MEIKPLTDFENLNLQLLKNILNKNKIPTKKWTSLDGTKTISDLFKEIVSGESELGITSEQTLVRVVNVVAGDIFYKNDGTNKLFRLKEDRQVFKKDGTVKTRPHLQSAVAEKMKIGEDPIQATIRGIEEELGISGNFQLTNKEIIEEIRQTPTYPGLTSVYKIHIVEVLIDKENFKVEGYIEDQADKTNHFVWIVV